MSRVDHCIEIILRQSHSVMTHQHGVAVTEAKAGLSRFAQQRHFSVNAAADFEERNPILQLSHSSLKRGSVMAVESSDLHGTALSPLPQPGGRLGRWGRRW